MRQATWTGLTNSLLKEATNRQIHRSARWKSFRVQISVAMTAGSERHIVTTENQIALIALTSMKQAQMQA